MKHENSPGIQRTNGLKHDPQKLWELILPNYHKIIHQSEFNRTKKSNQSELNRTKKSNEMFLIVFFFKDNPYRRGQPHSEGTGQNRQYTISFLIDGDVYPDNQWWMYSLPMDIPTTDICDNDQEKPSQVLESRS